MPHGSAPQSHCFRYKAPWLTWRYEYGLFFLEFPAETSRVPKPVYQENSQGCTLTVSRSALLVTVASLLVTSKTPFIVTRVDRKPLEILSNVLLKSSTTSLLTEMGREWAGRPMERWNLPPVAPHDLILWLSKSEKKKQIDSKTTRDQNTSGNQPIMFRTPSYW